MKKGGRRLLPIFMVAPIVDDLTASWPDWAYYGAQAGTILIGPGKGTAAASAGATVFKTKHYAERLAKEGVDVVRAEKAVAERIGSMRPNMSTGAEVRGRFELDGVLLEYRAYPLPNGSVNVGTMFPVKP